MEPLTTQVEAVWKIVIRQLEWEWGGGGGGKGFCKKIAPYRTQLSSLQAARVYVTEACRFNKYLELCVQIDDLYIEHVSMQMKSI